MSIFILERSGIMPETPDELHFKYVLKLLNNPNVKMMMESIQALIDLAYQRGYEDGQNSFLKEKN